MIPFGIPEASVIRGVRSRLNATTVDVQIKDGIIAAIEPAATTPSSTTIDGGYLIPGLVEPHIHLEKAYLLDRSPREAESLADAIRMTAELKTTFTPADMRARALRVLRAGLAHGVTTFRAHVEIDDTLKLSAIETMLELQSDVRGVVDLQIVAFPQEGLFAQRYAIDLMTQAAALGVNAIGGIPYADADAEEHLNTVFELAAATALPLDFHVDLSDDPSQMDITGIAKRTLKWGMQGRVSAGHVTALGNATAPVASAVADLLAKADVSVITLPTTDSYLNGRSASPARHRGLTPVRLLLAAGVNVAVSTNNIQNAFTPFGRGSLIDTAVLLASLCHFGSAAEARTVVDMMSVNGARSIGADHPGIVVGAPATFAIWPIDSERELLGDADRPTRVYQRGNPVSVKDLP